MGNRHQKRSPAPNASQRRSGDGAKRRRAEKIAVCPWRACKIMEKWGKFGEGRTRGEIAASGGGQRWGRDPARRRCRGRGGTSSFRQLLPGHLGSGTGSTCTVTPCRGARPIAHAGEGWAATLRPSTWETAAGFLRAHKILGGRFQPRRTSRENASYFISQQLWPPPAHQRPSERAKRQF